MTTALDSKQADLPGNLTLPLEVRVHGRGGQGGVTCAKLIAALYAQMGLFVQAFGDYGSERSGAPIQAFIRVDRVPITNRNKVYQPNHLFVLDESLLGANVLSGVAAPALLLVNATASPEAFQPYANYRIGIIAATDIAREHGIGTSSVVIINTTILGAYARMLALPLSALERVYRSLGLLGDLGAARQAYEQVVIREPSGLRTQADEANPLAENLPPDILPLSEHTRDLQPTLKTGGWSNQAPNYREAAAPCNLACPAGNDIVSFVQALKTRGPEAAAAVLLHTQALPGVCGRVCPAPCMSECNRVAYDGAVNIRGLERWIADHAEIQAALKPVGEPHRFAVLGGGPAGLSAAYQLALRGHAVTIFEAENALGGVLFNGIPAFRLPLEVLNRDIERILALGVDAQCGKRLNKNDLMRLQQEYHAVIVCIGFGQPTTLSAQGLHLAGVEQGLDFLDRAKRGDVTLAGKVVVVGGGNTAIDCARSALRCGADTVTLVYRRGRAEMPAIAEEIEDALCEGVRLLVHRQPVALSGDERVSGVVLAEVEPGHPDASGRSRPLVTDRTATLACDNVLLALGQRTEIKVLPDTWQIRDGRGWHEDRPLSVWFAGDCATGEGTVTHAIGNGRRVALAALADLQAASTGMPDDAQDAEDAVVAPAQVRFSHFDVVPPHKNRHLPVATCRDNFVEVNLGLAGPEEADRCFSCGHCTRCDTCLIYCPDGVIQRTADGYRVDGDYCKGCGMCVAECPRHAMQMNSKT